MSDHNLLTSVQRGDRAALEKLVREHQRAVYGYLRARLLELADVEDLTQEVFLRAYQSRTRLDSQTLARPWLIGITRNVLREHVRRSKRRREIAWTELCLELETCLDQVSDHTDEALTKLPGCMDSLGPSARDALDLRYRDQIRLDEIAKRLKRSEGAVKLLMYRARQALKNCLDATLHLGHD